MAARKTKYRILVASSGDKIQDYFTELLPADKYEPIIRTHDAGETKRMLLSTEVDIVVINTPLPDEFGTELALDLAESAMGIMLLVKNDLYDQACYKVEDSGILTLSKPSNRQVLYSAVNILSAISSRLAKMEKKNKTLQEKMVDIRTVNRAKWLLIENLNMTEKSAHYYIEKQAMDTRLSRKEIAESIIRTYDK